MQNYHLIKIHWNHCEKRMCSEERFLVHEKVFENCWESSVIEVIDTIGSVNTATHFLIPWTSIRKLEVLSTHAINEAMLKEAT